MIRAAALFAFALGTGSTTAFNGVEATGPPQIQRFSQRSRCVSGRRPAPTRRPRTRVRPQVSPWVRVLPGTLVLPRPQPGELPSGSELLVLVGDEPRILVDEGGPWRAEVELARVVAEEFTVDAGPHETPIRVDVDLCDPEPRRRQVVVFVDPPGRRDRARLLQRLSGAPHRRPHSSCRA